MIIIFVNIYSLWRLVNEKFVRTLCDERMVVVLTRGVGLWEIEVRKCKMGGAYFHDISMPEKSNRFDNCELNGISFRVLQRKDRPVHRTVFI